MSGLAGSRQKIRLARFTSQKTRPRPRVGHQVVRFLSRLPLEVEEEFNNLEKSEKGLKYVNGEGIPIEIIEVLKHANAFSPEHHWTVNNLSEFGLQNMDKLKFCFLVECNELQTIIDAE
ncbi:hypothetical protein HYC85_009901 [Camellia sinensis]|uniref:Uncharacterized protein n=1 Tax=Camellia sinensis TaxID=4442 RepID=A0A7J7HHR5_CAMSI|nr:hypothetical protein HYC85_009901 [Camellia sinensis]